ncbi:stage III sporulation protein AG [Paenibacillus alkalitolerans]|uniref:stage III sporulation protein AG n=1 Tax=Paenibacillus alkalitolerans TaxID=2799335 RepID=UPI001F42FD9B|nr:stage III sporulation protein AG [Paenibacillus alkalitolerans]
MAKWWSLLEEKFGGGPGGPNRMNTFRWLLIAACAGVIFMLLNSFMTVKDAGPLNEAAEAGNAAAPDEPVFNAGGGRQSPFADYEASYENEMKEILAKIVGVGQVDVFITIDSTEEIVVERDYTDSQQTTHEIDQHGAKREVTSRSRSGEAIMSGDSPMVGKTIRPKVRGVVVVAEGAENLTVKKLIQEAVSKGLDVPAHKISIVPSKR